MKYLFIGGLLLFLTTSCDIQGVDTSKNEQKEDTLTEQLLTEKLEQDSIEKIKTKIPEKASDTLKLDNGIIITYFNKGKGETLKKGDMVKIDYRAKLTDGTVFDGNSLVKKPTIPFLVGWNQQTPGWDIAMEHLHVGDDVDIFLPSKYARGKAGIKGIVPPNSDNIISMKIVEKFEPTEEIDGIKIWKYDEFSKPGDSIKMGDEVYINYWASSESTPRYDNNYKRGTTFKLMMKERDAVPGLIKALLYGREGDRLMIMIPSELAYGKKGLIGLVKPNEDIFYDLQIAKVIKKKTKN